MCRSLRLVLVLGLPAAALLAWLIVRGEGQAPPTKPSPAHAQQTEALHGNGASANQHPVSPLGTQETAQVEQGLYPRSTIGTDGLAADNLAGRMLESRLHAHPTIRPHQARIRIGRIDAQDLADFMAEAGPADQPHQAASLAHLANIDHWLKAPIQPDGTGGWRVGPLAVPVAEHYRVLAWGEGGYFFGDHWVGNNTEEPASATLSTYDLIGQSFTGIDLRLRPQPGAEFRMLLSRQTDPDWVEETSQLADLIDWANPKLLDAYEGRPLTLDSARMQLEPLFPDPAVQLIFLDSSGRRSQPLTIVLEQERRTRVEVNLAELFDDPHNHRMDVLGRLVFPDGQPVTPALIRTRNRQQGPLAVDEHGRFRLDGLSTTQTTRFTARLPAADEGERPVSPERHQLFFDPLTMTAGDEPLEWTLPYYRWLVVELAESERRQLGDGQPYPVYVLQQRDKDEWVDVGADAFIAEADGMAISIVKPGTYRAVIALTPIHCLYSEVRRIAYEDREQSIPISLGQATLAPRRTVILRGPEGALANWPVQVMGDHASLPPLLRTSDAEGRVALGRTNANTVYLSVGEQEVALSADDFNQNVAVLQIDR